MISIPLSITASLVVLSFLGETLNTMTLGGLALAIGILVDDSTVTIENTHRLMTEEHRPLPEATLHGSAGIAVPTLVSTLAISCVFTSVVILEGPAKILFTPLGLAVVFAMIASYALSRTLTPIAIATNVNLMSARRPNVVECHSARNKSSTRTPRAQRLNDPVVTRMAKHHHDTIRKRAPNHSRNCARSTSGRCRKYGITAATNTTMPPIQVIAARM